MSIKFGPAGNPDSFYQQGNKSSLAMPAWLAERGLSAYEYQCSRGVRIKEKFARSLGQAAQEHGITLSIHAPYYINLSTEDTEMKKRTKGHIIKSLQAAQWMGATTVVMHPGGGPGDDRAASYRRAKSALAEVLSEAEQQGLNTIKVAVETMGKKNQMGSLEEVLDLCTVADNVVPCLDFGHLHAVNLGSLTSKEDFARILEQVAAILGKAALKHLHMHFSPIEFTKAGEKKHRTTLEPEFGPDFTPLAELLVEHDLQPTIICESNGRQAEDALLYQQIYQQLKSVSEG